ncbi:MAG: hypothetical protein AAGI68_15985 [Planctomycetota bacterium]
MILLITAVIAKASGASGGDATALMLPVTVLVAVALWLVGLTWGVAAKWFETKKRLDDAERERKAMRRQLEGLDRRKRPRAGEGVWP